jgi:hypothetical protein
MEREVMEGKVATPTEEQLEAIVRAGLKPSDWKVIRDRKYSMVIINGSTNEVKRINK